MLIHAVIIVRRAQNREQGFQAIEKASEAVPFKPDFRLFDSAPELKPLCRRIAARVIHIEGLYKRRASIGHDVLQQPSMER